MIHDKALATQISDMLWEISGQLDRSIAEVQEKCTPEEFRAYRHAIGKVMGELYLEALRPLYKTHPDLEPDDIKID